MCWCVCGRLQQLHSVMPNGGVTLCTACGCCYAGVFGTTLSQEYAIAGSSFSLSEEQLLDLAERAVQHCFCSEQEKQQMLQQYAAFRQQRQQHNLPQQPSHESAQQQQQQPSLPP